MELNQLIAKSLIGTLLFVAAPVPTIQAEEGGRGRLPDGSAYRTDSDGIQLVDHVAELEVTVEEMKRQLEAAQNEIRHKETIIASLQGGAPVQPALPESGKEPVCPPQPRLICPEPERTAEEVEAEMKKTVQLSEAEKAKAAQESARLAKAVQSKDSELSLLRAKLKVADEQIAFYKTLNGNSKESARASVSLSQPSATGSLALGSEPPNPKDEIRVREKTLENYRKDVVTELNQARELMQQRDQLFAQYSSSGKSLKIKPSAAHSSQNRTIEQLQKDVQSETSLRMLALLAREVKEIREKVADDIELVKRINH